VGNPRPHIEHPRHDPSTLQWRRQSPARRVLTPARSRAGRKNTESRLTRVTFRKRRGEKSSTSKAAYFWPDRVYRLPSHGRRRGRTHGCTWRPSAPSDGSSAAPDNHRLMGHDNCSARHEQQPRPSSNHAGRLKHGHTGGRGWGRRALSTGPYFGQRGAAAAAITGEPCGRAPGADEYRDLPRITGETCILHGPRRLPETGPGEGFVRAGRGGRGLSVATRALHARLPAPSGEKSRSDGGCGTSTFVLRHVGFGQECGLSQAVTRWRPAALLGNALFFDELNHRGHSRREASGPRELAPAPYKLKRGPRTCLVNGRQNRAPGQGLSPRTVGNTSLGRANRGEPILRDGRGVWVDDSTEAMARRALWGWTRRCGRSATAGWKEAGSSRWCGWPA